MKKTILLSSLFVLPIFGMQNQQKPVTQLKNLKSQYQQYGATAGYLTATTTTGCIVLNPTIPIAVYGGYKLGGWLYKKYFTIPSNEKN